MSPSVSTRRHSTTTKFKTYNRIFYPLLIMESNYNSHRKLIGHWMAKFIEMDPEIVSINSCDKGCLPLNDAIALNSNMVETVMNLCKDELYLNYSLHKFIDIACINPKLEYRVLQWIQICIEKYDQRLLHKNLKHLSPLQYAEKHEQYYCSQIILYLKRKQTMKRMNSSDDLVLNDRLNGSLMELMEDEKDELISDKNIVNIANESNDSVLAANYVSSGDSSVTFSDLSNSAPVLNRNVSNLSQLQNEILSLRNQNEQLKQENTKWRSKYLKMQQMYQQVIDRNSRRQNGKRKNEQVGHHRVHSYPTPKAVDGRKMNNGFKKDENIKRVHNGFLLKNYRDWNGNDIVNWIINLNVKYKKYEHILSSNIIRENIRGKHLSMLNRNDLGRLGVSDFSDKYDIIEEIRILMMKHNQRIQKEGFHHFENGVNIMQHEGSDGNNNNNDLTVNVDDNNTLEYPAPI